MPLKKGKKNVGKNIKTLMNEGGKQSQAMAIAESVADNSKPKKPAKGKGK